MPPDAINDATKGLSVPGELYVFIPPVILLLTKGAYSLNLRDVGTSHGVAGSAAARKQKLIQRPQIPLSIDWAL